MKYILILLLNFTFMNFSLGQLKMEETKTKAVYHFKKNRISHDILGTLSGKYSLYYMRKLNKFWNYEMGIGLTCPRYENSIYKTIPLLIEHNSYNHLHGWYSATFNFTYPLIESFQITTGVGSQFYREDHFPEYIDPSENLLHDSVQIITVHNKRFDFLKINFGFIIPAKYISHEFIATLAMGRSNFTRYNYNDLTAIINGPYHHDLESYNLEIVYKIGINF